MMAQICSKSRSSQRRFMNARLSGLFHHPHRPDHDRPAIDGFQQVTLGSDGLGYGTAGFVSLGADYQGYFALGQMLRAFSIRIGERRVFHSQAADAAIVRGVESIGQAQNSRHPQRSMFLGQGKPIQRYLPASRQRAPMIAGDDSSPMQQV